MKFFSNKKLIIIASGVLLLLILGCIAFFAQRHYLNTTYTHIGGVRYPRQETHLDLSGQQELNVQEVTEMTALQRLDVRGTGISPEEYDILRTAFPDCNILWDIPFQGQFYDQNTSQLTVTTLSMEDIPCIAYFKNLRQINAAQCTDYDALLALRQAYPNCKVSYFVQVGSNHYPQSTTDISAKDATYDQITLALRYLPRLKSIHLSGRLPTAEELTEIQTQYPDVSLSWEYALFGQTFANTVTEIDLSDIPMESVTEVEESLPYFPALEKVIMCNCGISNEDMDALNRRHEDVRFVWSVRVGTCILRTDVLTFMPYKFGYFYKNKLTDADIKELKYCTDLICIDFGHMRVSDLSFLYYMPNMKYLLLCENPITDITPIGSCTELLYLELFITNFHDVSPLLNCKKLEDLNLCYTFIHNLEVLKDMPNLKHLWLNGTIYYGDAVAVLKAALPNTVFCDFEKGSSTGFGWRKTENYYDMRDLLEMHYMSG